MEYGINIHSVVPCRFEPSHRSEMVTQLLFGEKYTVLEKQGEWIRIQNRNDNYQSWISGKQHYAIDKAEFESETNIYVVQDFFQPLECITRGALMVVPPGSEFHGLKDNFFRTGKLEWKVDKPKKYNTERIGPKTLLRKAMMFLESPYLWGGKTPWGIDCSGLTQLAYKLCGIQLPRDAKEQALTGKVVDFAEEAREGDLAFFHNEEGNIIHVGMVAGERKIIHASGKVRMDSLDHYGIYNHDMKKYTHHLRVIKRYIQ